ncbi:hypothetical protein F5X98DRAFT_382952 [Xylaria grammica]|nr:hypothetical protein F5X98DRAFT_382952 [Xylaria grammica]
MSSNKSQATGGLSFNNEGHKSSYKGVYTGEYRASFRERIHGLRNRRPVPAPLPLDDLTTGRRTASGITDKRPRTPTPIPTPLASPVASPVPERPSAPLKGKVDEIRRRSQEFDLDALLDRVANERRRRPVIPCLVSSRGWGCGCPEPTPVPDVRGHIPGRSTPLRNSWGSEELAQAAAALKPYLEDKTDKKLEPRRGSRAG